MLKENKMKKETENLSELEKATYSFRKQISKQKELYEARLKEKEEIIRKLLAQIQGPGIEHKLGGSVVYNPNSIAEIKYSDVTEFMQMKYDISYFGKYVLKNVFNLDIQKYQCDWLNAFNDNRNTLINAFRQSGKTLTMDIAAIWYAIFHSHSTIGICTGNKILNEVHLKNITDLLNILAEKRLIDNPIRKNKNIIEMDNESKIYFYHCDVKSILGKAHDVIMYDEFAFYKNINDHMERVLPPVLHTAHSKLFVISSPNGYNGFYDLMKFGKTDTFTKITTTVSESSNFDILKEKIQNMLYNCGLNTVRAEYYCEFIGPEDPGIKIKIGNDQYFIR